uniref:(northern house mosquito) hypothetical protein n=1 Tax=Culex pipiens TaxID=7175 RepID=A0A8D8ET41_CULPI
MWPESTTSRPAFRRGPSLALRLACSPPLPSSFRPTSSSTMRSAVRTGTWTWAMRRPDRQTPRSSRFCRTETRNRRRHRWASSTGREECGGDIFKTSALSFVL